MSNDEHNKEAEDRLSVYYGLEKYSPEPYHNFEVGGLHYTTSVKEGETPEEAFERAYGALDKMARRQFKHKLKSYTIRSNTVKNEVHQ